MTVNDLILALPSIAELRDRCRAMAMLDAIICPEWQFRYYSFDPAWSEVQQMASMRNGSGDGFSIVFSPDGAYGRGFDHESSMSPFALEPMSVWPGLLDSVPEVFHQFVNEPAFCAEGGLPLTTVCFWRGTNDPDWSAGQIIFPEDHQDPDGANLLFNELTGGPPAYQNFAEGYYDLAIDLAAVRHVYALRPITERVASALNPSTALKHIAEAAAAIGYPSTT